MPPSQTASPSSRLPLANLKAKMMLSSSRAAPAFTSRSQALPFLPSTSWLQQKHIKNNIKCKKQRAELLVPATVAQAPPAPSSADEFASPESAEEEQGKGYVWAQVGPVA